MTAGTIGSNFIRGKQVDSSIYAPAALVRNYAREQAIIFQDPTTSAYTGGWDNVNKTTVGTVAVDWSTTVSADKTAITLNVLSATGRNFINETFPNPQNPFQPPLEIGKFYAFVCEVTAFSGTVGSNNMQIAAGGVGLATVVVGYNVIRFTATATTAQCRIGVGPGGALGSAGSMSLGKMWFTEIESLTANVPDYVPPNSSGYMQYAAGNTVSGNVLTLAQGALVGNPPTGLAGIGCSDSLGSDYYEWPAYLPQLTPGRSIRMMSQPSRTMEDMATMFPLLVDGTDQSASLADFSYCVIEAGINDIIANKTAVQIMGYLDTILATLPAGCITVVANIAPFGAYASWSAPREAERVAYNAALAARSDIVVADIASILTQQQFATALPTTPTLADGSGLYPNFKDQVATAGAPGTLSAGDGLHWNAMGEMAVAVAINAAIDAGVAAAAASGGSGTIMSFPL